MTAQRLRITIAENAGSCFGVNRALSCVDDATEDGPLYTFGPLIHNPRTIQALAERGVQPLTEEQIATLPRGSRIVLRAHGTAPQAEEALTQKGFILIDATCPFVKKAQEAAAAFAQKGLTVVITGKADHPEIESLLGYASGAQVISNREEVEKLIDALLKDNDANQKRAEQNVVNQTCRAQIKPTLPHIGLLSQTTQSKAFFSQVERALKDAGFEVEVANTICEATKNRQDDACKLAEEVDVMFVLGGRNSANTTRLFELCSKIVPTYHIESTAEIAPDMLQGLLQVAHHIGITAGASTPQSQIQELVDYLSRQASSKGV